MKKIIFDCDNTMGFPNCDVDDGLTLLYLLGKKDISLEGLTLTYGNNSLDVVYSTTLNLISDLNLNLNPYKGTEDKNNRISEASKFLATTVKNNPHEIIVLATGALTNIYGAYLYDNAFFDNVKEIVLMGGITKPLIVDGQIINELNFSCDAEATYNVINSNAKISILNGHTTMEALFSHNELEEFKNSESEVLNYIYDKILPWCERNESITGFKGFCNWDVAAAIYITNPKLFKNEIISIKSSISDLSKGLLKINSHGKEINMPSSIINLNEFNKVFIDSLKNL